MLYTIVFGYDASNSTDTLCYIVIVSTSLGCSCKWIYGSKWM